LKIFKEYEDYSRIQEKNITKDYREKSDFFLEILKNKLFEEYQSL
jgi:hypothetical protein